MQLWHFLTGLLHGGIFFHQTQNPDGNSYQHQLESNNGQRGAQDWRLIPDQIPLAKASIKVEGRSNSIQIVVGRNWSGDDEAASYGQRRPSLHQGPSNDIIEELQEQIDKLNKQMREIKEKIAASKSKDELSPLENKFDDLYMKLEQCYSKVDQLSQSQKQEWKQKVDAIHSAITALQLNLSDRIEALESKIEQNIYRTVIGAIRDGNINMAASTFKTLKSPKMSITGIVSEAYKGQIGQCQNLLGFMDELDNTGINGLDNIEIKGLALSALYQGAKMEMFTEKGSDCVFQLGWRTMTWAREAYGNVGTMYKDLYYSFPTALIRFVGRDLSTIRKGTEACKFSDPWDRQQFYKKHIGDNNVWRADSDSSKGKWFYLEDTLGLNYLLESDGGKPFISRRWAWADTQLWKPILVGNQRIQLKHKQSGKYLNYVNISPCYEYSLNSSPVTFYVE